MRLSAVSTFLFGVAAGTSAGFGQEVSRPAAGNEHLTAMISQMFLVEIAVDADRYVAAKGGNHSSAIDDILALFTGYEVGGFVLEGGNDALYLDPAFAAVRQAETPDGLRPIVAVNEEGGRVQMPSTYWWNHHAEWIGCTSLGPIPGYRAENPPPKTEWICPDHAWSADVDFLPFLRSAHLMGEQWTAAETKSHAEDIGRALARLNISMDLAPVLGISNGTSAASFLADRTFGDDPATVVVHARAFSRGIQAGSGGQVTTIVKHFPGLGGVHTDTDDGPARTAPLLVLEDRDLVPYREPIADYYGAVAVMMSNAIVPGLTCRLGDRACAVPATLSPAAYQFLRGTYAWDGLIMTDTLQTKAVLGPGLTLPKAVVAAVEAGADFVMFKPGDDHRDISDYHALLRYVQQAMLEWVADDPLARTARIEQSFNRIRTVKASMADGPASGKCAWQCYGMSPESDDSREVFHDADCGDGADCRARHGGGIDNACRRSVGGCRRPGGNAGARQGLRGSRQGDDSLAGDA